MRGDLQTNEWNAEESTQKSGGFENIRLKRTLRKLVENKRFGNERQRAVARRHRVPGCVVAGRDEQADVGRVHDLVVVDVACPVGHSWNAIRGRRMSDS